MISKVKELVQCVLRHKGAIRLLRIKGAIRLIRLLVDDKQVVLFILVHDIELVHVEHVKLGGERLIRLKERGGKQGGELGMKEILDMKVILLLNSYY